MTTQPKKHGFFGSTKSTDEEDTGPLAGTSAAKLKDKLEGPDAPDLSRHQAELAAKVPSTMYRPGEAPQVTYPVAYVEAPLSHVSGAQKAKTYDDEGRELDINGRRLDVPSPLMPLNPINQTPAQAEELRAKSDAVSVK